MVLVCNKVTGKFCRLPGEVAAHSIAKLNRSVTGKAIRIYGPRGGMCPACHLITLLKFNDVLSELHGGHPGESELASGLFAKSQKMNII
jgi:hypothetical protein